MRFGRSATAAIAVVALGATGVSGAVADDDDYGHNRQAKDTRAEYTPGSAFTPVASSTACPGEPGGRQANPFVIPPGYDQTVVAEETDPVPGPFGGSALATNGSLHDQVLAMLRPGGTGSRPDGPGDAALSPAGTG